MRNIAKEIDKILWGKSIVSVNIDGSPHFFILRSLTMKENNFCQYMYEKEYSKCLLEGILTQQQMIDLYKADGMWSDNHEQRIEFLKGSIERLNNQLRDFEFQKSKQRRIESQIKEAKRELEELQNIKFSIYISTAEHHAEEMKRRYIVAMATEKEDESKYWPSLDDFMNDDDIELIASLASRYYEENNPSEHDIRSVARNNLWRFRWNVAKSGADLYGKPIAEWSELQSLLVYWSQFYDYVFDSGAQGHIVEDDDLCDKWVKEKSKGKEFKQGPRSKKTRDHNEVFIFVDKDDKETVKKIHESNPVAIRKKLQEEHEKIRKAGIISEVGLRGKGWIK